MRVRTGSSVKTGRSNFVNTVSETVFSDGEREGQRDPTTRRMEEYLFSRIQEILMI